MHASIKTKIDHLPGVLLVTDEASRIVYANEAAVEKTGFCVAEAIGKRPGELWGGNMSKAFYQRMWHAIGNEKRAFTGVVSNNAKRGERYEESLFIVPLLEKSGGIRYFAQVKPRFSDPRKERLFREAFSQREETLTQSRQSFPWILAALESRELARAARGAGDILEWIRTQLVEPTDALFRRRHEDAQLIREAQADPSAFAALYERYVAKVRKYFLMRVDRDTAADLTQEVFIKSFRALPAFRITNASYSTYLLHVAHNSLVNHYRKQGNAETYLFSEEAEHIPARPRIPGGIGDLLVGLTEVEKTIMLLKYEQGYKAREIAEKVGKSENAVKLILSRTRKKLRERRG